MASKEALDRAVAEDVLLATPNRELGALFRRSPAGPVPAGVLDGVAAPFPGSPISRVVAGLRHRITRLNIRATAALVRDLPEFVRGGAYSSCAARPRCVT